MRVLCGMKLVRERKGVWFLVCVGMVRNWEEEACRIRNQEQEREAGLHVREEVNGEGSQAVEWGFKF